MSDPTNLREVLDRLNWPFPTWEQLKPVREMVIDMLTENWTNGAVAVLIALTALYQAWNRYVCGANISFAMRHLLFDLLQETDGLADIVLYHTGLHEFGQNREARIRGNVGAA